MNSTVGCDVTFQSQWVLLLAQPELTLKKQCDVSQLITINYLFGDSLVHFYLLFDSIVFIQLVGDQLCTRC